jgi:hypothetical protein
MLGVHRPGALAEKACLLSRNLVPLPEHLDPVDATIVPDALVTPVQVRQRAGIGPGDRVAVLGAGGGVGVHMVQVARLAGASLVGLDVVPATLSALADRLGIPALDASDLERVRLLGRWRDAADAVVDLVGSPTTLAWSTRSWGPPAGSPTSATSSSAWTAERCSVEQPSSWDRSGTKRDRPLPSGSPPPPASTPTAAAPSSSSRARPGWRPSAATRRPRTAPSATPSCTPTTPLLSPGACPGLSTGVSGASRRSWCEDPGAERGRGRGLHPRDRPGS